MGAGERHLGLSPVACGKTPETAPFSAHSPHYPLSTLEEVDPLPSTVAVSREGHGRIHVVRNAVEAVRDFAGVIRIQDTIIEAPVLTPLKGREGGRKGEGGWLGKRQSPPSKAVVLVPDLSPKIWNLGFPCLPRAPARDHRLGFSLLTDLGPGHNNPQLLPGYPPP